VADVDFAFIDADEPAELAYYEEIITRLRANGLLLVDSGRQRGRVLEPTDEANVSVIKAFNDAGMDGDRVDVVMLPISDGSTMLLRRELGE
jgi:caffeoyl-CoA O-methyltransferase